MECGTIFLIITSCVVIAGFIAFGFLGNTSTIIILWRDRAKSATPALLIILAMFDNGFLLVMFINKVLRSWCQVVDHTAGCRGYNDIWAFLYALVWPFGTFFHMASALSVVMVTFVRFAAVQFPHSAKTFNSVWFALCLTGVNVLFSASMAIPRFFRYTFHQEPNSTLWIRTRTPATAGFQFTFGFEVIYYYMILYVIPISALVYMTYKIFKALKNSKEQSKKQRDDKDITRSILGVVIFFLACQSFNPVRRVLASVLEAKYRVCPFFYFYYYDLVTFALTLNSSCNFIIYILLVKRFRQRFKKVFHIGINEVDVTSKTDNTTIA